MHLQPDHRLVLDLGRGASISALLGELSLASGHGRGSVLPVGLPAGLGHLSGAIEEALDAPEGLFQLLVGRGVAHPHVPFATGPEGAPGDDGHLLPEQQPLGELLAGEPAAGDRGEGVEGPLGPGAGEADAVQPLHEHLPAPGVLLQHGLHVRLAVLQGLQGSVLGRGGGGEEAVLVHLHQRLQDLCRGAGVAHPPPGHGVALGEAVEEDRALAGPGEGGDAGVLPAVVDQAGVDLVRVEQEVVLHGEADDRRELGAGDGRSGGIVGVAQHNAPGARGDRGGDLPGGDGEALLSRGGHHHRRPPAKTTQGA